MMLEIICLSESDNASKGVACCLRRGAFEGPERLSLVLESGFPKESFPRSLSEK